MISDSSDRISVDIALPVYHGNREILAKNIKQLHDKLELWQNRYNFSILISINGPFQNEISILAETLSNTYEFVRVLKTDHQGKGQGVFHAWMESKADVVCYMDVDLATDLDALPTLLANLKEGADLAIGSRYCRGARMQRTFKKLLLSKIYHLLLTNSFLDIRLSDVQCGFKACRRNVAQGIIPKVKDRKWFFEAKMLFLAYQRGYRIQEIPVAWRESTKNSLHTIRASFEFLSGVLHLKFLGSCCKPS